MNAKTMIRNLIPPALTTLLRKCRRPAWRYSGTYAAWRDAQQHARGYDAPEIIAKVFEATQKVIAGEAVFERDSMLFHSREYHYPLLFALYRTAIATGRLHVLDFGGALGSTFRQHLPLLRAAGCDLSWNVVEQAGFVAAAQRLNLEPELHFYRSIEEASARRQLDTILFSSVLQYLEDPSDILRQAAEFRYLIVDRHPEFCEKAQGEFSVQEVSEPIYDASYPVRIWGKNELRNRLRQNYRLLDEWTSEIDRRQCLKEKNGRQNFIRDIGTFWEKSTTGEV